MGRFYCLIGSKAESFENLATLCLKITTLLQATAYNFVEKNIVD